MAEVVAAWATANAGGESLKEILARYVGQDIGINWKEPKKYNQARLIRVADEVFTVSVPDVGALTYPTRWILNIVEGQGGITTGGLLSTRNYPALVEIFHVVVYSGAFGVGVSF